jgi:hypothetical protein
VYDPSITRARSNSYCSRRNTPDRAASTLPRERVRSLTRSESRAYWPAADRPQIGSPQDRAAAVEAGGRPELAGVIVGIEGRDAFGQGDPGQLGANIDVHIGRHRRGIVERADADEAQLGTGTAVNAPERYFAGAAAISCGRPLPVGTATGSRLPDSRVTWSASISALSTKAIPVCRWQSRQ